MSGALDSSVASILLRGTRVARPEFLRGLPSQDDRSNGVDGRTKLPSGDSGMPGPASLGARIYRHRVQPAPIEAFTPTTSHLSAVREGVGAISIVFG